MNKRVVNRNVVGRCALILVLTCAFWGSLPALEVKAATITVDNLTDGNDGSCSDGDCSLREAVDDATGGDTITFDSSLAGEVITLTAPLTINKNLIIDGSGLDSKLRVSGDNTYSVFYIYGSGVTVEIISLEIVDGNASTGAGVGVNESTVNITDCRFDSGTGNYGAGIYNIHGNVTVTDSTFYNNSVVVNGGAIDIYQGTVTVIRSTFLDNHADSAGGAINSVEGTLNVYNSTLYNNDTDFMAGGIMNNGGTVTLSNATLSTNTADIAAGGIFNSSTSSLYMTNTIISDSAPLEDCMNSGTIVLNSENLIEDDTCDPDHKGDPGLIPPTDNGGLTETMALGQKRLMPVMMGPAKALTSGVLAVPMELTVILALMNPRQVWKSIPQQIPAATLFVMPQNAPCGKPLMWLPAAIRLLLILTLLVT